MARRLLHGCVLVLAVAALPASAAAAPSYLGVQRSWLVPMQGYGHIAIAVAPDSTVYVLGADNRVHSFTRDGVALAEFPAGTQPSPYVTTTTDLTADAVGDVLVAHYSQNLVEKFSPGGEPLAQWHVDGPRGIDRAPDGDVEVFADEGIVRISATGNVVSTSAYGRVSTGLAQFAVDGAGAPYVAVVGDYKIQNWFVVRLGSTGATTMTFAASGFPGDEPGVLGVDIGGFTVDGAGRVWIADPYNYRVQTFSATGKFLVACGCVGAGAPLGQPTDVAAAPDGSIYVQDGVYVRRLAETTAPAPSCAPPRLTLKEVKFTPSRFRPARLPTYRRRGATVSYRLSEPAPVAAVVFRVLRGGRRLLKAAQFTPAGHKGLNRVRLSGWTPIAFPSGRPNRLAPGRYILRLQARSYGQTRTVDTTFVVL